MIYLGMFLAGMVVAAILTPFIGPGLAISITCLIGLIIGLSGNSKDE